MSSAEEAPSLIGCRGKKLCRSILVRFVNFAGVKVKNSISRVNDVSRRSAPLKGVVLHLVSMAAQASVVAAAVRVNLTTCASCAPSSVSAVYMAFLNANSVVTTKLLLGVTVSLV